jgi:Fe-S-cluster containining protein
MIVTLMYSNRLFPISLRSDFLIKDWQKHAETVCLDCGARCCYEAHPPVSSSCYELLTGAGISPDNFEFTGYTLLKTKQNGECILLENDKCRVHSFKPETCRAGPFTFDVQHDMIVMYLKHETLCPVVRLLKSSPEAYRQQYERAVQNITHLVRNLTEDEISAICQIDEPETEKVAEVALEVAFQER